MSRGSTVPRLGWGRDEREVRRPGGRTWCGRAGSGHSARAVAQVKGVGQGADDDGVGDVWVRCGGRVGCPVGGEKHESRSERAAGLSWGCRAGLARMSGGRAVRMTMAWGSGGHVAPGGTVSAGCPGWGEGYQGAAAPAVSAEHLPESGRSAPEAVGRGTGRRDCTAMSGAVDSGAGASDRLSRAGGESSVSARRTSGRDR